MKETVMNTYYWTVNAEPTTTECTPYLSFESARTNAEFEADFSTPRELYYTLTDGELSIYKAPEATGEPDWEAAEQVWSVEDYLTAMHRNNGLLYNRDDFLKVLRYRMKAAPLTLLKDWSAWREE